MAIIHSIPHPTTGAPCGWFSILESKVKHKESDFIANVCVGGWLDEAQYLSGNYAAYNWHLSVPLAAMDLADFTGSIERALVSLPGSPFQGGSITTTPTDLETAKARRWAMVKQIRNDVEFGPFTWDGSVFDGTPLSQERITKGVLKAMAARIEGTEFSENWTLADNSVRTLDGEAMFAVARAMGAQMETAFDIGQALRLQIEAAQTIEEVEAVAWPT